MKKIISTLCICIPLFAFSQTLPYTFTTLTGQTYSDLTGSVSLNNGEVWDDPDWTIGIGFNFDFFGAPYSSVTFFGLGGSLVFGDYPDYNDEVQMLSPYMQDVADAAYNTGGSSLSNVSFKTEGPVGSQIFKLEWKNTSFYDDDTGTSIVNFQMWLYEGSNNIEYHFGPSQNVNGVIVPDPGFIVGMAHDFNLYSYATDKFYVLSGNPASPTILEFTSLYDLYTAIVLSETPANGIIYRFASDPVGLEELSEETGFSIQPNPVADYAIVQSFFPRETNLSISTASGQTIESLKVNYGDNPVTLDHLPAGMYFIRSEVRPDIVVKFIKE